MTPAKLAKLSMPSVIATAHMKQFIALLMEVILQTMEHMLLVGKPLLLVILTS